MKIEILEVRFMKGDKATRGFADIFIDDSLLATVLPEAREATFIREGNLPGLRESNGEAV